MEDGQTVTGYTTADTLNEVFTELKKYNSLAKKYNAIPIEKRIIPLKELRILETIFKKMTDEQKRNAQPFPECLPKNKQEGGYKFAVLNYSTVTKLFITVTRLIIFID